MIRTARRYYLQKRRVALADLDDDSVGLWRAKQEAEPGAALSQTFPCREQLADAGYSTVEDLDGADSDELLVLGLTEKQAANVLQALAALT